MSRREGTAKVADVGLAHVVHASHIAELDALGTFAYAAPELSLTPLFYSVAVSDFLSLLNA